MAHPRVNGMWVKQEGQHAGNVFYKHSTKKLFLYAQEKNGYWIIGAELEGPRDSKRFYFARDNDGELPMEEGLFIISYSSPHQAAKFVITYGASIGKIINCV